MGFSLDWKMCGQELGEQLRNEHNLLYSATDTISWAHSSVLLES